MAKNKPSYAVVVFVDDDAMETESASEVPSNWLDYEDTKCWWPMTKNVGSHIFKKTSPDKTDATKWQLCNIQCLGFYDSVASARQKANGISSGDESSTSAARKVKQVSSLTTINEERQPKRRKNAKCWSGFPEVNKQDHYAASDESESADDTAILSPPNLTEVTNDNEKIQRENAITIKKTNHVRVVCNDPVRLNLDDIKNKPSNLFKNQENLIASHTEDIFDDNNGNFMSLPLDTSMKDFFIDNKSISLQIENLTVVVKGFNDKIAEKLGDLTYSIRRIENRLDNIERAVNTNQIPIHESAYEDLASLFPLITVQQVKELENHLTLGDVRARLTLYFAQIGGNSAKDCVTRILNKVFGPEVAKCCSWCGLRGNFKVGDLILIEVIKEAVKRSYTCTDKFFEDEGKEWFRQGSQKFSRIQKKMQSNQS